MIRLITSIAVATASIAGVALWLLKRYGSLAANIEKAETKRDELDEKIKNAIAMGDGIRLNDLQRERTRLSKQLCRLYGAETKATFIDANEPAPFTGVLLTRWRFWQLVHHENLARDNGLVE